MTKCNQVLLMANVTTSYQSFVSACIIKTSRCLLPNTIFGTPVRANKTPLGGAVMTFPDLRSKATASKAKVDEEIMRPVIAPDDILGLIKKWRPPPHPTPAFVADRSIGQLVAGFVNGR